MSRSSLLFAGSALATTLAIAGCSHDDMSTSPFDSSANLTAAAQFNHMGDSVLAAGGSASDAAPFYGAAGVIDKVHDIATISVSIDGTVTSMNAVAVATEVVGGPIIACPVPPVAAGTAAPYVCPWGIPRITRTLFAWTTTRPTQIVTLVASSDSGSIGTPIPIFRPGSATPVGVGAVGTAADSGKSMDSATVRPIPAHLEFRDGHHTWWGISGTQMNTVKANGDSCSSPSTNSASAPRPHVIPAASCQLADFTFSFNGIAGIPPVAIFGNANMAGTHAISMSSTSMTGVYFKLMTPALVTPQ